MPKTPGCYAALLDDCDGGPTTAEHYISESLLMQFGGSFHVHGASWAKEPRRVSPASLTGRVLCRRHNEALSALDAEMSGFHRAMRAAHEEHLARPVQFDGELLERWSLKALIGAIATGSLFGADGRRSAIPEPWLRALFGHILLPVGCGFYYINEPFGREVELMSIGPAVCPDGHPEVGSFYGVIVQFAGFRYLTSLGERFEDMSSLTYRPSGFVFGARQPSPPIGLRWNGVQKLEGFLMLSTLRDVSAE